MYDESIASGRHLTFQRSEGISTTDLVNRVAARRRGLKEPKKSAGFTATTARLAAFRSSRKRALIEDAKRVVLLVGDFDFLHPGHMRTLKAAAAMGDFLLVGLVRDPPAMSDAPAPVLSLGERTISLLSCSYVDDVVLDMPLVLDKEMLEAMRVSVVVKVEGHSDFEHIHKAIDWAAAAETDCETEVVTLDMSANDFSTDTIVQRVEKIRPRDDAVADDSVEISARAAPTIIPLAAQLAVSAAAYGAPVSVPIVTTATVYDRMSDALLAHTTAPKKVLGLYSTLALVTAELDRTGCPWWTVAGTLLGAVRHGGMIPWDDDIDLCISRADLPLLEQGGAVRVALEEAGWTVAPHPDGAGPSLADSLRPYPFVVIYPKAPYGELREDGPSWFRDPHLDIFIADVDSEADGMVRFADPSFLPNMVMPRSALYPLRRMAFGSVEVNVPAQPEVLLDNSYGKAWASEACLSSAHSTRAGRVPLAPHDKVAARPTGPIATSVQDLLAWNGPDSPVARAQ